MIDSDEKEKGKKSFKKSSLKNYLQLNRFTGEIIINMIKYPLALSLTLLLTLILSFLWKFPFVLPLRGLVLNQSAFLIKLGCNFFSLFAVCFVSMTLW